MKIAIIGMGHVGTAMHGLFREHAELVTYDTCGPGDYPEVELATCNAGIICVDTPMGEDGACDTSHVRDAVTRLPIGTVLLKSTVPPGTTEQLARATGKQMCFSPEYVGESSYHELFWPGGPRDIPFVILGGEPEVRRWFVDLLQPVLGPAKTYFQCSAREAEIIKYMENAYLAAKVTFVNEFRKICEAFGADWHTVREGWLLDPRVESAHTAAFASAPGFGGKCLPKDLNAIIRAASDAGYSPLLLREILNCNAQFQHEAMLVSGSAPRNPGQLAAAAGERHTLIFPSEVAADPASLPPLGRRALALMRRLAARAADTGLAPFKVVAGHMSLGSWVRRRCGPAGMRRRPGPALPILRRRPGRPRG